MAGVSGKSDTEARSPAVSMISATLARSGPGESLGGQVILGPHHARRESYQTSASHNFIGQRNALPDPPCGAAVCQARAGDASTGQDDLCRRYKASWSDISTCRSVYRRVDDEGFMHSTSNTYLGLSKATRLVSSPMMVPRAASLDSFTGTPRAAPIRA